MNTWRGAASTTARSDTAPLTFWRAHSAYGPPPTRTVTPPTRRGCWRRRAGGRRRRRCQACGGAPARLHVRSGGMAETDKPVDELSRWERAQMGVEDEQSSPVIGGTPDLGALARHLGQLRKLARGGTHTTTPAGTGPSAPAQAACRRGYAGASAAHGSTNAGPIGPRACPARPAKAGSCWSSARRAGSRRRAALASNYDSLFRSMSAEYRSQHYEPLCCDVLGDVAPRPPTHTSWSRRVPYLGRRSRYTFARVDVLADGADRRGGLISLSGGALGAPLATDREARRGYYWPGIGAALMNAASKWPSPLRSEPVDGHEVPEVSPWRRRRAQQPQRARPVDAVGGVYC